MKRFAFTAAVAALAATAIAVGCNSKDDTRLSKKGEACNFTNDCNAGLSCLPRPGGSGGVCVTGEFHISSTAKECALIQCDQPVDCCPEKPSNCAELDQECQQSTESSSGTSGTSGTSGGTTNYYCDQYQQLCVCDQKSWACDEGTCRYDKACSQNTECTSGACVGGHCAECKTDDQCGSGSSCIDNKCVEGCSLDSDCPNFYRCEDGACVEGTCQSNRECVAATGNVEATCDTNAGKCVVPCETDLECGSSQDYRFYSCINNECVYTGCESDKECELYMQRGGTSAGVPISSGGTAGSSGSSGSSGTSGTIVTGTKRPRIVCRDVVAE
jgi:hypothetical protein